MTTTSALDYLPPGHVCRNAAEAGLADLPGAASPTWRQLMMTVGLDFDSIDEQFVKGHATGKRSGVGLGIERGSANLADGMPTTLAQRLNGKLRGLRAMVAVLDQGAVGRAAKSLHLSQPAVTRALRDLESDLGFPLFERAARGMVPMPAGRVLGRRAKRAFAELVKGCGAAIAMAPSARPMPNTATRFAAMVGHRPLASLVAVADCGSGPRAGSHLGCSQPTIHRNLVELEHLVGISLFRRTPEGTRLTDPGEVLLRGVKLALAELAIAADELAAFAGRLQGRVAVAGLPLSSGFLLPRALDRLLARHPHLQVTVVDGTYDALIEQLRSADVDLIVGALRIDSAPADLAQEVLFEDELAVIARAGHPCLAAEPRGLADLIRHPWLVPLPNTPARAAFERAFRLASVACPGARLQVNSPAVVRTLLLESDRLALLSPLQVDAELRTGQLVRVPLALRDVSRPIGVTTRRDGCLSPGSAALLEELRGLAAGAEAFEKMAKKVDREASIKETSIKEASIKEASIKETAVKEASVKKTADKKITEEETAP